MRRWVTLAALVAVGCPSPGAGGGDEPRPAVPADAGPTDEPACAERVADKIGESQMLALGGHLHRALAAAREARARCDYSETIVRVARLEADLGLTERAIAGYREALAVEEHDHHKVEIEKVIAELAKRPPAVRQASEAERADAQLLYRDGVNLRLAGQHDRAIQALRRSYALWPHPVTIVQIALAHRGAGREVEARKTDARALAIAELIAGAPARPELVREHFDRVRDVDWASSGRMIASISKDGTAKLWSPQTGRVLATFPMPDYGTDVALSGDGSRLVIGGGLARGMTVIDVASGETVRSIEEVNIASFDLSPDGRRLASGARQLGRTVLWDATTGRELRDLGKRRIEQLVWSGDGALLAGVGGRKVAVWDAGGELVRELPGHGASTRAAAFAPTGDLLATGGIDKAVRLWRARTGARVRELPFGEPVQQLQFSRDGRRLLVAGPNGARLYDAATGAELGAWKLPSRFAAALALSPDGGTAAVAGGTSLIHLVDAETGAPVRVLGSEVGKLLAVAFTGDGRSLAVGGDDGAVTLWRLDRVTAPVRLAGHRGRVTGLVASADGRRLASSGADQKTLLWNARTGKQLAALTGNLAADFTAAGDALIVVGHGKAVELYDARTGQRQGAHGGRGTRDYQVVAMARDPSYAVIGGTDFLRVEHLVTGRGRMEIKGLGDVLAVDHHPGRDEMVALGPGNGLMVFGSVDPAPPLADVDAHGGLAWAGRYSPDGRWLATGGADRDAVLWDTATWKPARTLAGHLGPVRGVAFSPDGRLLATASDDKTVRLWETSTGAAVATLYATGDRWLVLAADGRVDGTEGARGATGHQLIYWRVGATALPGYVGWNRAHTPGLLRALVSSAR